MSVSLLDVNILLALVWPSHAFHASIGRWFQRNRAARWATCTLTQAGFVRLHSQPIITDYTVNVQKSLELLTMTCREPDHEFWPHANGLSDLLPVIRNRLIDYQQLTDAILLDLAIRRGGRLVTLDRRVANLLAPNSPHLSSLEIISQE